MKNSSIPTWISALFFSVLLLSFPFSNLQALERVRWKLQIGFAGVEQPAKRLIEQIKSISEGKIKLRLYKVNTLVPGMELHSAVGSGQLDAGFTNPGYFANKIPAVIFFGGVPFGPRLVEHNAWMQHGGGQRLKDRIYDEQGLVSLQCGLVPPESGGWFNKPYVRIEELKGTKMRIWGFGGKVLKKFGVVPKELGAMDIVPALEKGVIDAAEFSTPHWDYFVGIHKVFKYNYYPGWIQPIVIPELIVNKLKWDELSDASRLIIRTSCDSLLLWMMVMIDSEQPQAMRKIKQKGVEFVTWRDSELKKLRKAWHEVAEEESAKDPLFAEVYKSYKSFREQYAIWGDRAYLN